MSLAAWNTHPGRYALSASFSRDLTAYPFFTRPSSNDSCTVLFYVTYRSKYLKKNLQSLLTADGVHSVRQTSAIPEFIDIWAVANSSLSSALGLRFCGGQSWSQAIRGQYCELGVKIKCPCASHWGERTGVTTNRQPSVCFQAAILYIIWNLNSIFPYYDHLWPPMTYNHLHRSPLFTSYIVQFMWYWAAVSSFQTYMQSFLMYKEFPTDAVLLVHQRDTIVSQEVRRLLMFSVAEQCAWRGWQG